MFQKEGGRMLRCPECGSLKVECYLWGEDPDGIGGICLKCGYSSPDIEEFEADYEEFELDGTE